MVMEAPPSPQSVGREFVRQYYTLLNKAPTHLHRFYNNQSSFVHGGLDPPNRESSPMIGQKQIHQKIQQLNFRDCHAKITQVDAQATLGNGVVVQVTGELSNAGQPMRRFTQTFVLAAQSPKKYYVHNDIFRYQDEIVSDDECEPENRSETEDDVSQERQIVSEVPHISPQPIPTYYSPNTAPLQPTIPPVPHHHSQPPPVLPAQSVSAVNGTVHPDDLNGIPGQVSQHLPSAGQAQGLVTSITGLQTGLIANAPLATTIQEDQQQQQQIQQSQRTTEEGLESNEHSGGDFSESTELIQEAHEPSLELATSNEPKTYATLLKSGAGISSITPNNNFMSQPIKSTSPPLNQNRFENRDLQVSMQNTSLNSVAAAQRNPQANRTTRNNQTIRMPRQESRPTGPPGRNTFSNEDNFNFEDRRKSQNSFNDSNQLFLGNLPHSATEEELREIFSQFGTIVDLRIHTKPGKPPTVPGGRTPPNYGFITYDSQQAVQNCLQAKPLFYPNQDKNGIMLNVEEKKTKDRPSYGNRMNTDSGIQRPRDNTLPRRGPTGPPRGGGTSSNSITSTSTNRPNNFNRGPSNRSSNNTYSRR